MMSEQTRWYRDIRLNTTPQHMSALFTKLFHGLHACMSYMASENGGKNYIGVGFPAWNSHSVGSLIRLVSIRPELLEQIEYEPVIGQLLEHCTIHITPVTEVPEERVFAEFIYQRSRTPEKQTHSFIERQNRRRTKRGHVLMLNTVDKSPNTPHYIALQSSQTKHNFSLFLKRKAKENRLATTGHYSFYGLASYSNDKSDPPTVPHFPTHWQPTS